MIPTKAPCVTVLMPVYNAEAYLDEAVRSILGQSFTDFEFLIVLDGSTDRSEEVVADFQDPRIRVLKNDSNVGIVKSLNRGLREARGQFLARMDSDDIADPQRLRKQVEFMWAHPEVDICGTAFEIFDASGLKVVRQHPRDHEEILRAFYEVGCVLGHPTVLWRMKKDAASRIYYESGYEFAEDFRLWWRWARGGARFHNLPETLLQYRAHDQQLSRAKSERQIRLTTRIRKDFEFLYQRRSWYRSPSRANLHKAVWSGLSWAKLRLRDYFRPRA